MITVIIVLAAACAVILFRHHKSDSGVSNGSPSLTLYYNDGKTVLYHRDSQDSIKSQAPYFVNMVEAQLEQKYGPDYLTKGSWKVTTTLDEVLQLTAEKVAAKQAETMKSPANGADEIAAVSEDVKTGQIRVLVGGTDTEGAVNYANTRLPGGSSMTPFSYAALIEGTTNTGAGSPINDTKGPLPGYPCTNTNIQPPNPGNNCAYDADLKYPGTLSVRYALGGNRRIPAIEAMLGASPQDRSLERVTSIKKTLQVIDDASTPGAYQCYSDRSLTKTTQCYGAAAGGDSGYITLLNQLRGLSTIANNGKKTAQIMVTAVNLNGKKQSLPVEPKNTQVIRPDTAYILNNILSDPNASYLPGSCTPADCTYIDSGGYKFQRFQGWDFAVDPGSTINGYGATMASWSTQYAAITWAGNSTQTKAISPFGEYLTEPLTREMMEDAHAGKKPLNWQQPKDIQTLPAFVVTQPLSLGAVVPSPATDIYPSWYKSQ